MPIVGTFARRLRPAQHDRSAQNPRSYFPYGRRRAHAIRVANPSTAISHLSVLILAPTPFRTRSTRLGRPGSPGPWRNAHCYLPVADHAERDTSGDIASRLHFFRRCALTGLTHPRHLREDHHAGVREWGSVRVAHIDRDIGWTGGAARPRPSPRGRPGRPVCRRPAAERGLPNRASSCRDHAGVADGDASVGADVSGAGIGRGRRRSRDGQP